jgi:hypothetical protein
MWHNLDSADYVSYKKIMVYLNKSDEQFMFKSFIDLRGKDLLNYGVIKPHSPFELTL